MKFIFDFVFFTNIKVTFGVMIRFSSNEYIPWVLFKKMFLFKIICTRFIWFTKINILSSWPCHDPWVVDIFTRRLAENLITRSIFCQKVLIGVSKWNGYCRLYGLSIWCLFRFTKYGKVVCELKVVLILKHMYKNRVIL